MKTLQFTTDGILHPGDFQLTFDELRASMLVTGDQVDSEFWDTPWRLHLVNSLEVLTKQLWEVGIDRVFADGSFVEDKDHPNDIDGYFEVPLEKLATGELEQELNLRDPHKWELTMIRNEKEYKEAVARLAEERRRLEEHRARLEGEGLDKEGIDRVLEPIQCFHLQLREEVESYERLKQGNLGEVHNLHGLGRILVGLRIARGINQKDLADRLGVHESQVSRDERNEYHGITVERAARVLDALEAELASAFATPVLPFQSQSREPLEAS